MEIQPDKIQINQPDFLCRNHFNDLANDWDKKVRFESLTILKFLSRLRLSARQVILDVGCGTGLLFPYLNELTRNQADLFAIDSAFSMTQIANAKNHWHVTVLCGDIQSLPFRKEHFDRIIAYQIFPHIANRMKALKECMRVLKKNGELAIIHPRGSFELNNFHQGLGGIVENHFLPPGNEMERLLVSEHFSIIDIVDQPGEYFVSARKC